MLGPTGAPLLGSHGSEQLLEPLSRQKGSLLERPGDRGWPATMHTPLSHRGEAPPWLSPLLCRVSSASLRAACTIRVGFEKLVIGDLALIPLQLLILIKVLFFPPSLCNKHSYSFKRTSQRMRSGRVTLARFFHPGKHYALVFILRTKPGDGCEIQEEEENTALFSPFRR